MPAWIADDPAAPECGMPPEAPPGPTVDADEEQDLAETPWALPQDVDEARLRQWLAGVVRQDEAAFAELYQACVGRVYGLALRIVREPGLAEEVAEDCFWQVWRQAPRFDPARGPVMAWVMTIARSRALDAFRARQRAQADTVSAEVLGDGLDALRSPGADDITADDPHDLLQAVQRDDQLHQALARLDALPRQLLALAFFRGLTHEEIAGHTGMPLGTVKSLIRRSLTQMRHWLSAPPGAVAAAGREAAP